MRCFCSACEECYTFQASGCEGPGTLWLGHVLRMICRRCEGPAGGGCVLLLAEAVSSKASRCHRLASTRLWSSPPSAFPRVVLGSSLLMFSASYLLAYDPTSAGVAKPAAHAQLLVHMPPFLPAFPGDNKDRLARRCS